MLVARPCELARHDAAAEPRVALEHEHLFARGREVGRGHEAVVPGADGDDVVRSAHGKSSRLCGVFSCRSRRSIPAAAHLPEGGRCYTTYGERRAKRPITTTARPAFLVGGIHAAANTGGSAAPASWDTAYEWRAVTLLGIGFGLVGLDRWIIAPLFRLAWRPISGSTQDVGQLVGALGSRGACSRSSAGRLVRQDRASQSADPGDSRCSRCCPGCRAWLQGLTALIVIRALMGCDGRLVLPDELHGGCGGCVGPRGAASIKACSRAGSRCSASGSGRSSRRSCCASCRRGMGVLDLSRFPGSSSALLLFVVLREPAQTQGGALIGATQASGSWIDVLKSRNIVRRHARVVLCDVVRVRLERAGARRISSTYLKLEPDRHGRRRRRRSVSAASSASSVCPGFPIVFGRKLMAVHRLRRRGAYRSGSFAHTGAAPVPLFLWLFVVSFFCLGNVALITGPIATEAAPPVWCRRPLALSLGRARFSAAASRRRSRGASATPTASRTRCTSRLTGVVLGIVVSLFAARDGAAQDRARDASR